MMWVLIFAVPVYILQIFLHESWHALAALKHNMRITSFKIWPHWVIKEGKRVLYLGRVTYAPGQDFVDVPSERAVRAIAPLCVGSVLWFAIGMVIYHNRDPFDWRHWLLSTFFAGASIDLLRILLQPLWRRTIGDMNQWARALEIPRGVVLVLSVGCGLFILIASVALLWLRVPW